MAGKLRGTFARLSAAVAGSSSASLASALLGGDEALHAHGASRSATAPYKLSTSTYQANELLEDRHDFRVTDGRLLAAVLDGHGGWQAAEYARRHLLDAVARELGEHSADPADPTQVAGALTRAFTSVDRGFLTAIKPAFDVGFGDVAHVGCCALVAVTTRAGGGGAGAGAGSVGARLFGGAGAGGAPTHVIVANAGDCRAVLGRVVARLPEGASVAGVPPSPAPPPTDLPYTSGWQQGVGASSSAPLFYQAVALSFDHNAREGREKSRLAAEHPGESDIVMCKEGNPTACYVKARLQPTRALGDAYLKHSEFNGPPPTSIPGGPAVARAWGRHIRAPYTPPYITSIPEVAIHKLAPGVDDRAFLILACDGVWDVLSNEEAVAFVAQDGGDRASVADRLRDHVLAVTAKAEGMDEAWIRGLKPGKNGRRRVHDDITVIVSYIGAEYMDSSSEAEGRMDGQGQKKGWW